MENTLTAATLLRTQSPWLPLAAVILCLSALLCKASRCLSNTETLPRWTRDETKPYLQLHPATTVHRKSDYINTVMTGLTSLPYLPVTVHVVCFGLYKLLQCPRGEAERTYLRFEGATSGQSGSWELRWASLDSCRTWKSQRSEKIAQQYRWFWQTISYRTKPTK